MRGIELAEKRAAVSWAVCEDVRAEVVCAKETGLGSAEGMVVCGERVFCFSFVAGGMLESW